MNEQQHRETEKKPRRLQHWQKINLLLTAWDILAVALSWFGALWIRFDMHYTQIPMPYLKAYAWFIGPYAALAVVIFQLCRMYRSIWRFASYSELKNIIYGTIFSSLVHYLGITIVARFTGVPYGRMPISYYLIGPVAQFGLTAAIRFSYRFRILLRGKKDVAVTHIHPAMIIGAGESGRTILRDLNHAKETEDKVVCIIDDNPNKWNRQIDGVPVVGGRDEILSAVKKYGVEKIYFAIAKISAESRRDLLQICNESGCEVKVLPGIFQLVNGEVSVSRMKNVSVEDLLGREPIRTDMTEVFNFIHGKRVLVTGGGGSIGSELCRQIAAHEPEQLIIFDIYENNAYNIQLELRHKYPKLNLVTLIGSVRDSRRVFQVFETYRPQIVYHAAAHKHVPLMEDSPCEAIKNNAIGTYKTAYAAMTHGCERFVLISTDKAVNPTNIMGASKRLCEMVIQAMDAKIRAGKAEEIPQLFTHEGQLISEKNREALRQTKTELVAVRFGNVLGSNGSVIPVFRRQIEQGGPVTVTHPDIIRYFMTIPEAVSLVMQAGTYAQGGEIYVLDMGSPVKIDTLARNLIRLSGFKPDVDIKIEYSGLRPGEKLYEEKLMAEEGIQRTANDLIYIGKPIAFDNEVFLSQLENLMDAAYKNKENIRDIVKEMVSTYHEPDPAPTEG